MMKKTLIAAALMLPLMSLAATNPPGAPQSTQQTSRSSAKKQMAVCQKKAKDLKGAAKETAVQNCMRGQ